MPRFIAHSLAVLTILLALATAHTTLELNDMTTNPLYDAKGQPCYDPEATTRRIPAQPDKDARIRDLERQLGESEERRENLVLELHKTEGLLYEARAKQRATDELHQMATIPELADPPLTKGGQDHTAEDLDAKGRALVVVFWIAVVAIGAAMCYFWWPR